MAFSAIELVVSVITEELVMVGPSLSQSCKLYPPGRSPIFPDGTKSSRKPGCRP